VECSCFNHGKICGSHTIGYLVFNSSKKIEIGGVAFKYDRSPLAIAVIDNNVYSIFEGGCLAFGHFQERNRGGLFLLGPEFIQMGEDFFLCIIKILGYLLIVLIFNFHNLYERAN